jgi:deoxyribodipyrimidine photo-lyase
MPNAMPGVAASVTIAHPFLFQGIKQPMPSSRVPQLRITTLNSSPTRADADYVLYWMTSARRTQDNFGLDRAIEHARDLGRPLLVFEALRVDYPWASDRLHQFVIEGMEDNAARFAAAGITYLPWVEPALGAGRGLLEALAKRASVVVTDEFPCFFLPQMIVAAASRLEVCVEQVDSNGLLPLRATPSEFPTAYAFRRFLHKQLAPHLLERPAPDPLANPAGLTGARLPDAVATWTTTSPWPFDLARLHDLPISHDVRPTGVRGGEVAARGRLARFVSERLGRYVDDRNDPSVDGTSGLSPYLHFGHIGAHRVFDALTSPLGWTPALLATNGKGQRDGFWNLPAPVEAFLDEFVTWREVGYAFCFHRPDYEQYESLPSWARATLDAHRVDRRPHLYSEAELAGAGTHDPIWNAAQRQLVREGRIHNYLRMLWGKKILEWSPSPEEALHRLIELNNRYSLDGRNPNSYSGIFWTLGRFDRAWGPVRPIFGTIRYMSSDNTARKLTLGPYLERYGAGERRPRLPGI